MFKLGASESYTWPVKIRLPGDQGNIIDQDFLATFKRLTQSEIDQMYIDGGAGKIGDRDVVKKVLIGWKDIVDSAGNPVPFSDGMLDQILEVASVAGQIFNIYSSSVTAGRTKN